MVWYGRPGYIWEDIKMDIIIEIVCEVVAQDRVQ
jgi:hypothetical protein